MYAGGMSARDIASRLKDLYGVEVGRDTISRVTDSVPEDIAAWRARPLDPSYPIVYLDASCTVPTSGLCRLGLRIGRKREVCRAAGSGLHQRGIDYP